MSKKYKNIIYKSIIFSIIGDFLSYQNGVLKYNKDYGGILEYTDNYDYLDISSATINRIIFIHIKDGLLENKYILEKLKYYTKNTVFLLSLIKSLNTKFKSNDEFIKNVKFNFIKDYEEDKEKEFHDYNDNLINSLKYIKNNKTKKYNNLDNSSDPLTRCGLLGLYFKDNINDLIYIVINIVKLTNNNGLAILGGITCALFFYYALNEVHINDWLKNILKLFNSKKFKQIYFKLNKESEYKIDLEYFIYQLNECIEMDNTNLYLSKNDIGDQYVFFFNKLTQNKNKFYPGNYGEDAIFIVYFKFKEQLEKFTKNDIIYLSYQKLFIDLGLNTGNNNNLFTIASSLFSIYNLDLDEGEYLFFINDGKSNNFIKNQVNNFIKNLDKNQ